jgi:tetratricopeptide (TPR) repeat protein
MSFWDLQFEGQLSFFVYILRYLLLGISQIVLGWLLYIYIKNKNYDDAAKGYENLLFSGNVLLNNSSKGISYSNLSSIYSYKGEYFKALDAQKKASRFLEKTIKKDYLASSLYNTGTVYIELGMYKKAKEILNLSPLRITHMWILSP